MHTGLCCSDRRMVEIAKEVSASHPVYFGYLYNKQNKTGAHGLVWLLVVVRGL